MGFKGVFIARTCFPDVYILDRFVTDEQQMLISLNAEDDDEAIQELKALAQAYIDAKRCANEGELVQLIRDFNLSWEHISTDMLNVASVWKALLKDLPIEAFLRNLRRMTRLVLFDENSEEEEIAVDKIRYFFLKFEYSESNTIPIPVVTNLVAETSCIGFNSNFQRDSNRSPNLKD